KPGTGEEDGSTIVPNAPSNLKIVNSTKTSLTIKFDAVLHKKGIKEYKIWRNGKLIQTTDLTTYVDKDLEAGTTYTYKIQAVANNGITSSFSENLTGATKEEEKVKPTQPTNLSSIGATEDKVRLKWNAADHQDGIKEYNIYRNGVLIGTSTGLTYIDNNLESNTLYKYKVQAIANNGLTSEFSNLITVKTEEKQDPGETQDPFYVAPPKTSGFNTNLREKLGHYGSYDGVKKSYFNSLVRGIASGEESELDVKTELYQLELWKEPNKQPVDALWGAANVYTAVYKTPSNNYAEIDRMIKKQQSGKYFEIAIYWDAEAKQNVIAVLGIQFMYQ
ncbi:fibronectin type III domain-containing protein, partial [Bacillus cereus]|nr:fibronectin type III domain-containing protein [Bacillus cereus]